MNNNFKRSVNGLTVSAGQATKDHNWQQVQTPPGKKVLFVIDSLEMGGAETSLLENCSRFRKIEPVVCHIYQGDLLKAKFIARGIKVYSINLGAKYGFLRAYIKLLRVVLAEDPSLIVACLTRSELVARAVAITTKIPAVGCLVSDLYGTAYNQQLPRKARLGVSFFKWLNKHTAGICRGFIANSAAIKLAGMQQLAIPASAIEVIHRGRDKNLFAYHQRKANDTTLRFLNIGRLVKLKGQADLVQAFTQFLTFRPDAVLQIAGDGPCRASLEQFISEYQLAGKVILAGNCNNLPELMPSFDCLLVASYSEGFSGVIVEAMMAGLPVIATDIPANREIITHLRTGFLFTAGSLIEMTAAMRWFTTNRTTAIEMAANARAYAVEHFELGVIASRMEDYLYQLTPANT
ncbi:MAG TPA: glycosyltransferase [Chitinophagaceae bacterium]|nr:glycosyltransferase [Chitinophagaceae bacterium]